MESRGQGLQAHGRGGRRVAAVRLPAGPRLLELLARALGGSGPAVIPVSPALPDAAVDALLGAVRPHELITEDGTVPLPDGGAAAPDTALIIATSGSTGEPKAVELSASALIHSAKATLERIGARPGDRWLCTLPADHIAGAQVLVRSLVAGTDPVIHERFDVAATPGAGVRHVSLVPTQLRRLLDAGADLSVFGSILLGGAAAPEPLLAEAAKAGGRVFTTYGMSETCGGCVYDGVPLSGVRLSLTDEGRIRLGGATLFSGYRLRPDLTAEVRDGSWFLTGDLGAFHADGRLRVRGRVDDVINTGGEKVVAGEVAAVLARHPSVAEAVVVGRPDREWGERVTAVVTAADPARPPALADLRAWVRGELPSYAAPHELEVLPEIPLLSSGKPDRRALREAGPRP
ncbi:MAG: AMP-binding protein [Streptosporangiales bacterium]|nr:AMP-binding protein [Streptosporangiales bacterium]